MRVKHPQIMRLEPTGLHVLAGCIISQRHPFDALQTEHAARFRPAAVVAEHHSHVDLVQPTHRRSDHRKAEVADFEIAFFQMPRDAPWVLFGVPEQMHFAIFQQDIAFLPGVGLSVVGYRWGRSIFRRKPPPGRTPGWASPARSPPQPQAGWLRSDCRYMVPTTRVGVVRCNARIHGTNLSAPPPTAGKDTGDRLRRPERRQHRDPAARRPETIQGQGNRVNNKGATPGREGAKKGRQDVRAIKLWRFRWLILSGNVSLFECKHGVLAVLGRPGALALSFCLFTRLPRVADLAPLQGM